MFASLFIIRHYSGNKIRESNYTKIKRGFLCYDQSLSFLPFYYNFMMITLTMFSCIFPHRHFSCKRSQDDIIRLMYTEKRERDTKGERRHILKKRIEQRGETINENTHEKKRDLFHSLIRANLSGLVIIQSSMQQKVDREQCSPYYNGRKL